MVNLRLPSSAMRCRASAEGAWDADSNFSCKVQDAAHDHDRARLDELSLGKQPGLHRRLQLGSLDEAYDVEYSLLGSGGFGIVRKAFSLRSGGPPCAVKTIAKADQLAEKIANNEAHILEGLLHPNICQLLEVCEDAGHIHLVLECVNGHELFEEILPRMKETRAACIMKQVFLALQYCHDHGVIHRDIKPENIMVAEKEVVANLPVVKLIDWGLAALCSDMIQTPVVGTACFMSPEALSDGIYSRGSDMWSAGATLYMLVTGGDLPQQFRPLSSSNSPEAKLLRELGTSEQAQALLHGLLRGKPGERFSAASAALQCESWSGISFSIPGCNGQKGSLEAHGNLGSCSERTALCTLLPLSTDGQLMSCPDVVVGHEDDFLIFDDFTLSPVKTKQTHSSHREQWEAPTKKSHNSLRRPFCATAQDCKENLGPGAPRVCKHTQAPSPASCKGSHKSEYVKVAPARRCALRV